MGFVQVENRSCKMLHFVMSCMRQKKRKQTLESRVQVWIDNHL